MLGAREAYYTDVFNSVSNGYNHKKVNRYDLPANEMATFYEKGMTLRAIGEQFGVCKTTVRLRVTEAGIPLRNWNERQYIEMSKEVLEHLYVTDCMTTYEIAKKFNASSTTVSKRLKKYGIPIRPSVNRKYLKIK